MTGTALLSMLPFLVLGAAIVVVMLLVAFHRQHRVCAISCGVGIVLALISLAFAATAVPQSVTPLFVIDGYALFYLTIILLSALGVTCLAYDYFEERARIPREEFYVLLLLATLGAGAMPASNHFAAFFVAVETLSISLIGLIAYPHGLERPLEAGIKYLILSGVASAFLLFGVALIEDELATLAFDGTAALFANPMRPPPVLWLAGVAMVLTGLGFKLSVVPFHMWAPDVYEGAPAPVTAFIAVVSKTAALALLLRYFIVAHAFGSQPLMIALSIIAVLSMLAGNLLALLQDNVKRMLAYSSIAHLGYLLVAFLAGGPLAIESVSMYLVAYAITTLGAFGVVTLLSSRAAEREADRIEDYRGLFWARPWLGATLAVMLLSLAGIPVTMGFIAKFYALISGVEAALAAPVAALVVGSIIGLFYYLRLIVVMLMPTERPVQLPRLPGWPASAVVALLLVSLVGLGVYPSPLISTIRSTAVELAVLPPGPQKTAQHLP